MKFTVISPFQEMFEGPSKLGLVGSGIQKGLIDLEFINPRKFTSDIHQSIDDRPYGGGDGMLMSPGPLGSAIEEFKSKNPKAKLIYLSPQGKVFNQQMAKEFYKDGNVGLLCGRYAGVDERLISSEVDLEVSMGDFILSGAEIASMAIIDAVSRLVPGVLGNSESPIKESFEEGLLEWPQFTRPRDYKGMTVPEVLLSGDHKKIDKWRKLLSILRTLDRRPELLNDSGVDAAEIQEARDLFQKMSTHEKQICGLSEGLE